MKLAKLVRRNLGRRPLRTQLTVVGVAAAVMLFVLVESLAAGYLDPYVGGGTKDFAPYVLMIIVLMIRPYGMFGRRQIERV